MVLKEKDFVEIKFTGRVKDSGEIFDSNIKEDLETLESNSESRQNKISNKSFVFPLGKGMFLKAIDDFLIGKPEEKKDYNIELKPEESFGNRRQDLIQMIPTRIFKEHNLNPVPGFVFNFDNKQGKVLTVSGGRVIVDFNHLLAGKDVEYKIKVLGKVTDINEKVKALNDFFFRKEFKFEIKDKEIILELPKTDEQIKPLFEALSDKYKEMLGLGLKVELVEDDKKSQ